MTRRADTNTAEDHTPHDAEDLDEDFDEAEDDRPVLIACQWGMPAWCSTGRHHRCYFTTHADDIKTGTYGP